MKRSSDKDDVTSIHLFLSPVSSSFFSPFLFLYLICVRGFLAFLIFLHCLFMLLFCVCVCVIRLI